MANYLEHRSRVVTLEQGGSSALADFHGDEDGKITLVAIVAVLALVALAGFIGNVGDVVGKKIETQNAADGIAFSSAAWMARGMNAVTATNHLLGEASAMVVIHEALGGPSIDQNLETPSVESRQLNTLIESFERTAPIGITTPGIYGERIFTSIDRRIVSAVVDLATDDKGRHKAGAMIYDSQMTLKREQVVLLPVKTLANAGFYVPPPFGYATAAAAYAAHAYSTVQLVLIGKEFLVLDVLEKVAVGMKAVKQEVLEGQLVPTLAEHSNFVAGWSSDAQGGDASEAQEEGIVNGAVERVVGKLSDEYNVEVAVFPDAEALRLPVEPEPAPSLSSGETLEEWGDDAAIPIPDIPALNDLNSALGGTRTKLANQLFALATDSSQLQGLISDIDEQLATDALPTAIKQDLEAEKQSIQDALAETQQKMQEASDAINELDQQAQEFADLESQLQGLPTESNNPSVSQIPENMDQGEEQYTQWVRATYPYVDAMRSPIISQFKTWLPKSNAEEHFIKWTNRYTLVKAWQFRSGYEFERTSNSEGEWQDSGQPLHMFVLRDSVNDGQDQASAKGNEDWTSDSAAGKRSAEQYFTMIGVAQREYEALFSSRLYRSPHQNGMTAVAQAIVYNANRQQAASAAADNQPLVGWDTLNWDPEFPTPEWGQLAADSPARWPWQILSSTDLSDSASVQLNWQAKLMPVTTTRLGDAAEDLSGDMKQNVDFSIDHFEGLLTH